MLLLLLLLEHYSSVHAPHSLAREVLVAQGSNGGAQPNLRRVVVSRLAPGAGRRDVFFVVAWLGVATLGNRNWVPQTSLVFGLLIMWERRLG